MNDKRRKGGRWVNPMFKPGGGAQRISSLLMMGSELRRKTRAGLSIGTFVIDLPCASTLNALALAGFDFVVLDMEHSALGFTGLESLIVAGQAAGLAVLVRIWSRDTGLIGKILDMGANGIMAPHVDTAAHAKAIVDECRFGPVGKRGFSPITRYASLKEPLAALNESTYVVVQVEGRKGLDNVRQISKVKGIDAIFIGPYDLALSMGVPPGSPEVFTTAAAVADTVPASVDLGIYVDDPARSADWAKRRFALQCISFDGKMLSHGARLAFDQVRAGAGTKARKK